MHILSCSLLLILLGHHLNASRYKDIIFYSSYFDIFLFVYFRSCEETITIVVCQPQLDNVSILSIQ